MSHSCSLKFKIYKAFCDGKSTLDIEDELSGSRGLSGSRRWDYIERFYGKMTGATCELALHVTPLWLSYLEDRPGK